MIKSWKELTIKKYREICKVEEGEDWQWNVLAILNDTTYEDIISRPLAETMEMSRDLHRWIDDKPIIKPAKKQYIINGHRYDFKGYPKDVTTAMYLDFYMGEKKIPDNLPDILAIVLHPAGCSYNSGYDIEEVKKEIDEHFNAEDALSLCDFFSSLFQLLQRRALKQARKVLKLARKDGIPTEKAEKAIEEYLNTIGLK